MTAVVLVRTTCPGVSSALGLVTSPVTVREQQTSEGSPPPLSVAEWECVWTGLLALCPSNPLTQ